MDIVILKLSSGEEVIAGKAGQFRFAKPRVVQVVQTPQGMQAALVPWMITAPDETVDIDSSFIVTSVPASSEVASMYMQQTSSLDLSAIR